jgi:hypothetical protein
MKTQIFGLLFISFLFVACTKNEVVTPFVNAKALASDSNFIKMLGQEKQLTHFINQLAIEKSLTIVELQNKLQYLHDKDLNSGSGDQLLYDYLGEANVNFMNSFAQKYQQNWSSLNKQYSYISIQDIDSAVKQVYAYRYNAEAITSNQVFNIKSNAINSINYISINKANDCGWKYALCMAAATAGGILCHANCIGLTAGLGTPVCVLLCGTIELAAGVGCIDSFCPLP